jgi:Haemolysin-III related
VHKGRERRIDLAAGVGVEDAHPQAHRTRCRFHVSHRGLGDRRIVRFDQQGEARDSGNHLAQQLKPLGRYLSGEKIDAGQIAPGPGEACDQIYLLIAGTYTPFLAQMKSVLVSAGLGLGVWLSADIGIALKLALPGRFDRLAIVLCLLLGWSGVIAYDSLASALPSASLWLRAIGGILYSVGALFHVWQGLRFHNAIWHGFVLIAASCHYSAVLACLPWA